MVDTSSALQVLWNDTCSVYTRGKTINATTKRTEFTEFAVISNQPCKLSFETLTSTKETDHAPSVSQGAKLFVSKQLSIPAGSKIVVTRDGATYNYQQSGEPGMFSHHQEIRLDLFEEWA